MTLTQLEKCPKCNGGGFIKLPHLAGMRSRREECGITLRDMAKQLGVSAPYLSDIELGRRNCPAEVLKAYEQLKK